MSGDRGKYLGEPGKDGAATVGRTIVSVLDYLSALNRTDVANSLELALRSADAQVGSGDNERYWKTVFEVLTQIGWVQQQAERSNEYVNGQTAGVDNFGDYVKANVAKDSLYSDAEKSVVSKAMVSLQSHEEKLQFFRPFTADGPFGSFAVSAVTVNNGELTMCFSAFGFQCNGPIDDYVTSSIKKIEARVDKLDVQVTLLQPVMNNIRSAIEDKLNQAPTAYIQSLDI